VLASIQLDNDAGLETREITNVGTNGVLSTELEVVDLPSPQPTPKQPFGISGVLATISCKAEHPGNWVMESWLK
jgi:hypothetical protein